MRWKPWTAGWVLAMSEADPRPREAKLAQLEVESREEYGAMLLDRSVGDLLVVEIMAIAHSWAGPDQELYEAVVRDLEEAGRIDRKRRAAV